MLEVVTTCCLIPWIQETAWVGSVILLQDGSEVMWEKQEKLIEKNYHFILITLAGLSATGIDSLMHLSAIPQQFDSVAL